MGKNVDTGQIVALKVMCKDNIISSRLTAYVKNEVLGAYSD